jgi:outer membrane protein assembly factor BamB
VLAFRATDGELIWRRDLGAPANAPPALAADRAYVPTDDGRVVALQVATGVPVWERRVGGKPNDILALDDRIYFGSLDNSLYCVIAKDGRIDWRWPTGGDVRGLPAYDEHNIYFVSLDNTLRALDRISGNQKWIRGLAFRPAWAPVRLGSTIAVAGQKESLRGYKITDGSAVGEISAGAEITAEPHVVATVEGNLPAVLVVSRDVAKGATAMLVKRNIEPDPTPVAPLPNPTLVSMPPRK